MFLGRLTIITHKPQPIWCVEKTGLVNDKRARR